MRHGSLFTGEGGFDLAAEWMEWENIFHCELNDNLRWFLNNRWPKSKSYADIKSTDFTIYRGKLDILTGGFPCQPYSQAGSRKGTEDERHLWPEMLRAIREAQPTWVVGENVRGLINWNGGLVFEQVQADLEAEGYEVQPFLLPAASVNAPHERYRIWFVAYSSSNGHKSRIFRENRCTEETSDSKRLQREWVWSYNERASAKEATSNSNSTRANFHLPIDKFGETEKEGSKKQLQPEYRQNGGNGYATNSHGLGGGKLPKQIGKAGSQKSNELFGSTFRIQSNERNVSNPYGFRLWRKSNREGNAGQFSEDSQINNWENFPTQSPICTGNDGFSSESLRQFIRKDSNGCLSEEEIDQIFSKANIKFGREVIKAGGNAIVPQIPYQIFKAIESYISMQNFKN